MELYDLTYQIRSAIFTVHNKPGPGLLESVYEAALAHELRSMGLEVVTQKGIPAFYRNIQLESGFSMDLLVENTVIIEIKSNEAIYDVHKKTLLTYLRLSQKKLGILVNFNVVRLVDEENLIRIIN
ncbi:MAG: GxxExxY protein [Flaviaesturariibacter sp.]|nr:GxxExxY protein [Flaviaesturariibacter sp.]